MIFLRRKRFIFWLFKAYLKRWGKTFLISFSLGLLAFLIVLLNWNFILSRLPFYQTDSIGIAGVYTKETLPSAVLEKASRGLTKVSESGSILPDLASKWEIKDSGKTYIFYLKDNLYFADGEKVYTSQIDYNFSDVKVEKPNENTLIFRLNDSYSPFLVTVATHKIFKKGFIGVGNYKISNLDLNGQFVQSVELTSQKERKRIKYFFYPTQEALKKAFVLGEISEILEINNPDYDQNVTFNEFKNVQIKKYVNYDKLVTLFYDNNDSILSEKKVRKALTYALPDKFENGERTNAPYSPKSYVNSGFNNYQKDIDYSKALLSESPSSRSGELSLNLKTLPQYEKVAYEIASSWAEIGVKTNIDVVESVPDRFQVFLGEFFLPKDPDQYILWHSGQSSNITSYRNLRIDKLLEDGRKIADINERKKIYSDFQKYLLDDQPAAFLFFPYSYKITRK